MKKNFIGRSLIFSMVALLLFSSCKKEKTEGGGQIVSETRTASNFYNVAASGSSTVIINYGNDYSIQVKGFENLIPKLETKVENGTLFIQYQKEANVSNDNIEVTITMPSLVSVSVNGNNEMKISGNFLGMDYFTATSSGNGNILINGATAKNFKIVLSGPGDVHAFGLQAQNAIINSNGSGNAEVNVSQTLNATLSGSGNVFYKGNPQVISTASGTGKVIKH